jgi:hypothetical protein
MRTESDIDSGDENISEAISMSGVTIDSSSFGMIIESLTGNFNNLGAG